MAIRNQKLPFMFEYWPSGASAPTKRFILPIQPENYRIQHNAKVSVTQTKGGTFTDSFGMGIARITLSGTFGLLGSLKGGPGTHIDGARKDSWSLLKEFEAEVFFDFYSQFGTDANPKQEDKAQLRFYNFTDEQFYEVIINPFTVSRNIQRRHLYQYQMEMQCIRDLSAPEKTGIDDLPLFELMNVEAPDVEGFSRWKTILRYYTSLSVKVSDMINTMNEAQRGLERVATSIRAFRDGISSLIAAPFELVETAIRSIDSILDSAISIKDLPHEFVDHLRGVKRTLLQSRINKHLFQIGRETSTAATQAAETQEITTAAIPSGYVADVQLSEGELPESTIFSPGIEQTEYISSTVEALSEADSIESFAARTTGDANQWRRIAFLNDLEPPFIASDFHDGFTQELEEGSVVMHSGRTVFARNITPLPGQIVILSDNGESEAATVEGYDELNAAITLKTMPERQYPPGAKITSHDGRLKVARPGDRLKIPAEKTSQTPTLGDYEDHYDRIFGADEYLDADGEHTSDGSGDRAIVVGLKNLEMQLSHRLKTMRGELAALGHPRYGSLLPALVGKSNTDYWIERIRFEAKATVLEDPRIQSVVSLDLDVDADAIRISAMVRTAGLDGERAISLLI